MCIYIYHAPAYVEALLTQLIQKRFQQVKSLGNLCPLFCSRWPFACPILYFPSNMSAYAITHGQSHVASTMISLL